MMKFNPMWLVAAVPVAIIALLMSMSNSGPLASNDVRRKDVLIVAGYGGKTPEHWQRYVYDAFTRDTGIKVEQVIVPGKLVAGIQAQQQARRVQWDITTALASDDYALMSGRGYLAPIPLDVISALNRNYPQIEKDGLPVKKGALIIVCNRKLARRCPTTAAELFDPVRFPGPRFFPAIQPLETLAFATYASGVPAGKVFPLDLGRATAALDRLRPSVAQFYGNSTTARQLLASGEVVMGQLWSGIPLQILAEKSNNVDLQMSWDGAVTYRQFTVVYKGAPHAANAWIFLKWLNDHPAALAAEVAAEGSDTTNRPAFALLPPLIRHWSPNVPHGADMIDVETRWYQNPGVPKAAIDRFWKGYTG